jgi:hypothetical protein
VVVLQSDAHLTQIALAIHPACCFSRGLHGWQQERDQDANDGDYDEQLHQRKAGCDDPSRREARRGKTNSPAQRNLHIDLRERDGATTMAFD